jgi:hypothetical protein
MRFFIESFPTGNAICDMHKQQAASCVFVDKALPFVTKGCNSKPWQGHFCEGEHVVCLSVRMLEVYRVCD